MSNFLEELTKFSDQISMMNKDRKEIERLREMNRLLHYWKKEDDVEGPNREEFREETLYIEKLNNENVTLIKIIELLTKKTIETNNINMKVKSENKKLLNQLKSAIDIFNKNRSEERVEEEEEEESVIMVKITHKRKWNSFIEKRKKRKT